MPRPKFILDSDINRWDKVIDNDPTFPKALSQSLIIREVCYAGMFLCEKLEKLNCPLSLVVRLQEAAGRLSYGNDPWDVSFDLLTKYENNELPELSDVDEKKIN